MRALLGFGDAREGLGENSAWRAIDQACCVGTTLDGDVDEFEFDAQSTSAPRPFAVDDSEGVALVRILLLGCLLLLQLQLQLFVAMSRAACFSCRALGLPALRSEALRAAYHALLVSYSTLAPPDFEFGLACRRGSVHR